MANRRLTRNAETIDGTTGQDRFRADIVTSDLGLQLNTLQTGDVLNGLGGRDRLTVDATTLLGDYNAKPKLNSIEEVVIASSSGTDNDFVLDLARSQGVRLIKSIGSDTNIEIRNAGSARQFVLQNFQDEDTFQTEGLTAKGITSTTIKADIINSDNAYVRFDKKGPLPFDAVTINLSNSSIELDVAASLLRLNSNGLGEQNTVSLDGTFDKVRIGGTTLLEFDGDDGQELEISTLFSAFKSTGGVTVEARIFGELGRVIGSSADDSFASIESESALTLMLGEGDDVALVVNAAGGLTSDAGGGNDELTVQNLVSNAADSIDMGGDDDILDVSAAPADLDGVGTNDSFDGGDGQDSLRILLNGLTATQGSGITGFEDVTLASGSSGSFDMAGLTGASSITLESFFSDFEFTNVANATSFVVEEDGNIISIDAVGAADLANVSVVIGQDEDTSEAPAEPGTTIGLDLTVAGFNTLTLDSRGGDLVDPTNSDDTNFVTLIALDTEALVITGSEELAVISNDTDNALTSVSASTATGDIDLTLLDFGTGSVIVTDGRGNDRLAGSEDADTFNLTNGGSDIVGFTSLTESDGANPDTINGFDSAGNDTLSFAVLGIVDGIREGAPNAADGNNSVELAFVGNVATTVAANAALAASDLANSEDVAMVFDQSTNSLFIDVDQSGAFVAGTLDVRIVINDINDALSLQDFELV